MALYRRNGGSHFSGTVALINKNIQNKILPMLDYVKLVSHVTHTLVEDYGTEYPDDSLEFIELPVIIRGRNTGYIRLGIVSLDLQSSGEHWGTYFLIPQGVIDPGAEKFLRNMPAI